MATKSLKSQWKSFACRYNADSLGSPTLSFKEFVSEYAPRYRWYRHCEVLADALQRVADGELKRLMVFMAPRHGKSELASRLFPAYYLYRHPDHWTGINSYAADLAYTFSRQSRDKLTQSGVELRGDAAAVKHWETTQGGGLWAAGVGGPITGKGFHLGLIDDPLKNAEEAASETIRRKQKDWYESTFYTRAEPDAAIVLIQTRWNEDDLAGWLLSMEGEEEPECWHIVNFAAIATTPPKFPESCTVEPDWRNEGEALCPERYPLERLKRIKTKVGSYFWGALYQQQPSPLEGGLFKRQWWKHWSVLPKFDQVIQSWDCTFKDSKNSDYVVGQVWGKVGADYYLIDQVRGRMDINATLSAVRSLSAKHPEAIAKLVEDKANGSAVVALLKREISGLVAINPEGEKVVRATAIAPTVEAGNVYLPPASVCPWVHDYIEELSIFPNGANDDQVDATSQALNWLLTRGAPVKRYQPRSASNW